MFWVNGTVSTEKQTTHWLSLVTSLAGKYLCLLMVWELIYLALGVEQVSIV